MEIWEMVLPSKQVKHTPKDSINKLIIWKMNPLVIPVTSVKFKSELLYAYYEQWIIYEKLSVFGQIENLWMN